MYKPKTRVISMGGSYTQKTYAAFLRKYHGVKARKQRSDAGRKRK